MIAHTVENRATTYAKTGNSADLIDHRHFNPEQQTDHQMEPYKPALIHQAILNVVRGQENTERGLVYLMTSGEGRLSRVKHFAWDVDTGHAVTCPLERSDIAPLAVVQRVLAIINGGLSRVVPDRKVELVIADHW